MGAEVSGLSNFKENFMSSKKTDKAKKSHDVMDKIAAQLKAAGFTDILVMAHKGWGDMHGFAHGDAVIIGKMVNRTIKRHPGLMEGMMEGMVSDISELAESLAPAKKKVGKAKPKAKRKV